MGKFPYIFFLYLLSFSSLFGQSYNFKNYSVENGLPFIQTFSIHQDNNGYLWSSGYGGLSKFDGKSFTNYSPKQGLANHYVNAVTSYNNSSIWIGTKNGLNELKKGTTFKTYTKENGLSSNIILALSNDKKNKVFIGTDLGLDYCQDGKFYHIPEFTNQKVNCLLFVAEVGLLVGTDNGLYWQSDGKVKKILLDSLPISVNCIAYNPNTGIWAGTPYGLFKYDPFTSKKLKYNISNGLIDDNISSLTADYKNNIWVGTHSGLMKFDGREFRYLKLSSDFNSNNILCSTIDYEENLWFGTHAGLFRFRDEGFVSYGPHDGLTGTMVFPIIRDHENNLFVGTEQFGLFKMVNGSFKQIKLKEKPFGDTINCLSKDGNRILIGSNDGICIMKGETFLKIKAFDNIPFYNIYKHPDNIYWAGSIGKIVSFELDANENAINIKNHYLDNKVPDYQIWGINSDNQGHVWVTAYPGGIHRFSGSGFQKMNETLKIKTEDIFGVIKSKDGKLYASSLEGVIVIDPIKLTTKFINEEMGISSNLVYSLALTENDKYLWIGTNQGVNKLNLFDYISTGKISVKTFNKPEGFKGVECNSGILYDPDGVIWFSTVNGLIKYNPTQVIINNRPSKLNLTNIKLFYSDTVLPENASLPYDQNNISFTYSGICLSNPEKVFYVHKLEGFDRFWSPEVSENYTNYSNLPPGHYTFKVRSCNNEGIWNEPVSYSFNIEKPYYQKWWFVLAVVAFMVSTIILMFRVRLNQLKRTQQKETEKQIEIAKNQLKALRAQMNPHFMFNSLNSIQNYIVNNKDDRAALYLNKFAKLMRMILNNSEKSHVTLKEELDAMKLYIELEQMRFQNAFQYKIIVSEDIDQDFEQIPTMLIQPYVENAILHGLYPKLQEGLLIIEIRIAGGVLVCSIIDNGIGRARSVEMKKNSAKEHKSLGMEITKQRLQILNHMNNSNLSVRILDQKDENGLPAGTKVDIFIPIT